MNEFERKRERSTTSAYLFTILSTVDNESKSRIRAVVGYRMVEVPQTLGCDVISHAGLGRIVVDVACDAENSVQIEQMIGK